MDVTGFEDSSSKAARFWDAWFRELEPKGEADSQREWIIDPEAVVRLLPWAVKEPLEQILEVGCGGSALGEHIQNAFVAAEVVGIDISPVAVELSSNRYAGRSGLSFRCMDALNLSFADESFDMVIDKGLLDTLQFRRKYKENRPQRERLLREVHRVLRPGGVYLIITPKARIQFLRDAVPWREVKKFDGSVTPSGGKGCFLDGGHVKEHAYAHACYKAIVTAEVSGPQGSPVSEMSEFQKSEPCRHCGVARWPRYKSEACWIKHVAWCEGLQTASAEQLRELERKREKRANRKLRKQAGLTGSGSLPPTHGCTEFRVDSGLAIQS